MKFNYKSRKGFTLIELLVVIGILAVLAAIAIPSVAGLIDRANVSADKTNSNEMTNAVERFASEYELYCQDIASGAIVDKNNDGKPDDLDSAQGRVYNVTGVVSRADIEDLEIAQNTTATNGVAQIYRDTKYPTNAYTLKKIVENYTKTSSSTFEPKQSDMHYWYSPDCGVVVFAEPNANTDVDKYLNSQILSGMDAKGNQLSVSTQWIDLTSNEGSIDIQEIFEIKQGTYASEKIHGFYDEWSGDYSKSYEILVLEANLGEEKHAWIECYERRFFNIGDAPSYVFSSEGMLENNGNNEYIYLSASPNAVVTNNGNTIILNNIEYNYVGS